LSFQEEFITLKVDGDKLEGGLPSSRQDRFFVASTLKKIRLTLPRGPRCYL